MHNDGNKVVPLSKSSPDNPGSSPVARLPVVLLQVRDKAAQQLKESLQTLFDNADEIGRASCRERVYSNV